MDYKTFETEFFSLLKKRDSKCLKLIDKNQSVVEKHLGFQSDSKTIDNFVEKLGNIVLNVKKHLFKSNNTFELVEKVLNFRVLGKVREVFVNSSDALIKALKNNNKDAANWLLTSMNINPKVQDEEGKTALMIAAKKKPYIFY